MLRKTFFKMIFGYDPDTREMIETQRGMLKNLRDDNERLSGELERHKGMLEAEEGLSAHAKKLASKYVVKSRAAEAQIEILTESLNKERETTNRYFKDTLNLMKDVSDLEEELAHERQNADDQRDRADDLQEKLDAALDTSIEDISVKGGVLDITLRPPQWAVKAMAASFAQALGNAPNWQAIQIGPMPSEQGMLIVTVRRATGDSPEETVGKLRACLSDLYSVFSGAMGGTPELGGRVLSLLNPEKKD